MLNYRSGGRFNANFYQNPGNQWPERRVSQILLLLPPFIDSCVCSARGVIIIIKSELTRKGKSNHTAPVALHSVEDSRWGNLGEKNKNLKSRAYENDV